MHFLRARSTVPRRLSRRLGLWHGSTRSRRMTTSTASRMALANLLVANLPVHPDRSSNSAPMITEWSMPATVIQMAPATCTVQRTTTTTMITTMTTRMVLAMQRTMQPFLSLARCYRVPEPPALAVPSTLAMCLTARRAVPMNIGRRTV